MPSRGLRTRGRQTVDEIASFTCDFVFHLFTLLLVDVSGEQHKDFGLVVAHTFATHDQPVVVNR